MIYVRDDDVLLHSSSHADPLAHFKTVHGWICETGKLLHVPAILVTEIQQIPRSQEAIDFIKQETKDGRMSPQIHGLNHIDYAKLPLEEIVTHLNICKEFLFKRFDVVPTTFYTPWGANAPHIHEAANNTGLKLVDCVRINKLNGRYGIIQRIKDGDDPADFLDEDEIFFHWWEGGMRLRRVVEVLKHGTWEKAKEANGDWFDG